MDVRLKASWTPPEPTNLPQPAQQHDVPLQNIKWDKLRSLSNQIYGSQTKHGKPTVCTCTANFIAIGTNSAEVLLFNYQQNLIGKFIPPSPGSFDQTYGPVCSLSISNDSRIVAAGFAMGYVVCWSIVKSDVLLCVNPISIPPKADTSIPGREAHIYGSAVTAVNIIKSSNSPVVVSGDSRGMVFEHHIARLFLERKVCSRILVGTYAPKEPTTLLDMMVIKLNPEKASEPPLLVTLTPYHFHINSLHLPGTKPEYPQKVIFSLPQISDSADLTRGLSGCIAWHQDTHQLAFCWSNSIKILQPKWIKNKMHHSIYFECTAERQWHHGTSAVVRLQFVAKNILLALTVEQQLIFIDLDTLDIIESIDMMNLQVVHHDYFSRALKYSKYPVVTDSYKSVSVQEQFILVLGEFEFYTGTFTNWADQLMACLNQSKPVEAVRLAIQFYERDDSKLQLVGLTNQNHQEIVSETLPDIVILSLRYTIEHEPQIVSELLDVCLEAITLTNAPLLENVYELCEPYGPLAAMLFDRIKCLALQGVITQLPPIVFQQILQYLGENSVDDVENVLFSLDTDTLDLNLAMEVCRSHNLKRAEMFLLSQALHDFVTPLTWTNNQDKFAFLAYSFCGKIYPTGKPMPLEIEHIARTELIEYLFTSDHHHLIDLLAEDAHRLFIALNETFEQSYLNEEDGISRQMIIENLRMSLQDSQVKSRSNDAALAVFIARNLSKYPQYIQVPGSDVISIVKLLCTLPEEVKVPTRHEKEFALLSLFSDYKPPDITELTALLREAGYFAVLEQIYRTKRDYKRLVRICIEHFESGGGSVENFEENVELVLKNDLAAAKTALHDNASTIASLAPEAFAKLVDEYSLVEFHNINLPESVKLTYLSSLFENSKLPLPQTVCNEYVILLSKNDPEKLMEVLESTFTNSDSVSLPAVTNALVEHNQIEALMLLLCRSGKYSDAIAHLVEYLKSLPLHSQKDFKRLALRGIEICTTVLCKDPEEGKKLWVLLLKCLLENKMDVAEAIQRLLETELDRQAHCTIDIVTEVSRDLKSTTALVRTLFEVMEQKQVAILATMQLLDGNIYSEMIKLLHERGTGWTVSVNGECEVCGHKVLGVGLNADKLYDEWESFMRSGKVKSATTTLGKSEAVLVFRCTHAYHVGCLEKFRKEYECIVCSP